MLERASFLNLPPPCKSKGPKMAVLKSWKLQISLLFLAAVLVGLFIFDFPSNPLQMTKKGWFLKSESDLESSELAKVLKRAATKDRTVILTILNEAWAAPNSTFDLFLESFQIGEGTSDLLSHLVVIAMDQKAFNRCNSVGIHCFSLTTKGLDFSAEKRYMTPDYLKMMWRRVEFLLSVLELGYHFIFTDADIMWLRNPFTRLNSFAADITIACDRYLGDASNRKNTANAGFFYVRSSSLTKQFLKYWLKARDRYPGRNEQDIFNTIIRDQVVSRMRLEIKFLDTAYFVGFCQRTVDLNKVCTVHANCCVGIVKKVYDLRLVLEDWRNFTALSTEEKRLNKATWRAPSKCKVWNK